MGDKVDQKMSKALADIQKSFGKGAVIKAKDKPPAEFHFSTGIFRLDLALNGGYPSGHMVEIQGMESSGKTTSAIHAVADAQSQGVGVFWMDQEGTFDPSYAEALGVDLETLHYMPATAGEDAINMMDKLMKTGGIRLVVLDSVATLKPESFIDGDVSDANMAHHAKLMSRFCDRAGLLMRKYGVCVIAINQLRERPGVTFGNPEYATGGNSLKFYDSIIMDMRKSGSVIKESDGAIIGQPRRIKVKKDKVYGNENLKLVVDLYYGKGFDMTGEILDSCVELEIINKSGSWYSYDGAKIAQGRESAKDFLRDNPELLEELKRKVEASL